MELANSEQNFCSSTLFTFSVSYTELAFIAFQWLYDSAFGKSLITFSLYPLH